jgi:hypothetical protein
MSTPSTKDRIVAVLKKNPRIPVSQLAADLGISRQRVYQACRDHGIALDPQPSPRKSKPPRSPMPRVITGGILCDVSHSVCGSISELLVAADLLARGFMVYHPMARQKGLDLIAVSRSGQLLTIEVRSGKINDKGVLIYAKKTDSSAAHHAVVVTSEPVRYQPELPENPKTKY